jgi:hypothetical protein
LKSQVASCLIGVLAGFLLFTSIPVSDQILWVEELGYKSTVRFENGLYYTYDITEPPSSGSSLLQTEITPPGTLDVTVTRPYVGSYSAELYSATGGSAGRVRMEPRNLPDSDVCEVEVYFNVDYWDGYIQCIRFSGHTFGNYVYIARVVIASTYVRLQLGMQGQNDGDWSPNASGVIVEETYNTTINTDTWYRLRLRFKKATNGEAQIFLDGSKIIDYSGDTSTSPRVDRAMVGFVLYQTGVTAAKLFIDDFSVWAYNLSSTEDEVYATLDSYATDYGGSRNLGTNSWGFSTSTSRYSFKNRAYQQYGDFIGGVSWYENSLYNITFQYLYRAWEGYEEPPPYEPPPDPDPVPPAPDPTPTPPPTPPPPETDPPPNPPPSSEPIPPPPAAPPSVTPPSLHLPTSTLVSPPPENSFLGIVLKNLGQASPSFKDVAKLLAVNEPVTFNQILEYLKKYGVSG